MCYGTQFLIKKSIRQMRSAVDFVMIGIAGGGDFRLVSGRVFQTPECGRL